MLEARNVTFSIGKKDLVKDLSYTFYPGKCYMLCGPNGAGKSTLLKLLSLQLKPGKGEINYNGSKVNYKKKTDYAKTRAVLSQNIEISFAMEVEEVIMMGRYPHFQVNPTRRDKEICDEIIAFQDLEKFRKRNFLTLSGGEKQRVQFARVLAQIWEMPASGDRVLLLDEPISALDIKYQFDFLQKMKELQNDRTILIAILHDLNLCLNYADELLLLKDGNLFASGIPKTVLSSSNIHDVFHIETKIHDVENLQLLWPGK